LKKDFKIFDNYLSEDDFKEIQKWLSFQKTSDCQNCLTGQRWNVDLLKDLNSDIIIKKPQISSNEYLKKSANDDGFNAFDNYKNKINDLIFSLPENKKARISVLESSFYRYQYKSGILLHRDSSHNGNFVRRYGITLYLNDEWYPNWGGELTIYRGNDDTYRTEDLNYSDLEPIKTIIPKRNRLVIVDGLWHRVSPNLNKNIDRIALQTFVTINYKPKPVPKVHK
tara:strand:- start:56 stop:730 length:675 start_codon:yes stop_codon:yes gene_type:complete